jgi:hypothetical protein
MNFSFFLLQGSLLLLTNIANAQIEKIDKYYPSNKLYKNLKVKTVIDSSAFQDSSVRVNEYDEEGRPTHSYYKGHRNEGSVYVDKGDTLFRFMYWYPHSKGLYSAEQFIYDNKKQIIKYILYRNSYMGPRKIIVSMDEFFYDEKQQVSSIIELYSHDYPDSLRENMPVNKDLLEVRDVIYYEHRTNKGKLMIIGKHAFGKKDERATDTLFYDAQKRLVKKASFAKSGVIGEWRYSNLAQIELFTWSAGKKTEENYFTYYVDYIPEDKFYIGYMESDHDISEFMYDSKGLLKEQSFFYRDGKKELSSIYTYEFYD